MDKPLTQADYENTLLKAEVALLRYTKMFGAAPSYRRAKDVLKLAGIETTANFAVTILKNLRNSGKLRYEKPLADGNMNYNVNGRITAKGENLLYIHEFINGEL